MNILFAVDEAYPIYKIGGLGDVGASLPKALKKLGVDIRIALPRHPEIKLSSSKWKKTSSFTITYNNTQLKVEVFTGTLPSSTVPVYLFHEEKYIFKPSDASDSQAEKFAIFSLALSVWISNQSYPWKVDIIHTNDWHTALVPTILKNKLNYKSAKTIISIHNLAYQGNTKTPILSRLNIPNQVSSKSPNTHDPGLTNTLLTGILSSDAVVAVSPTYAKEILTKEYGEGIEGQLKTIKHKISGIINGIDLEVFNPETDKHIYKNFSKTTLNKGKLENKTGLQQEFGLSISPHKILVGYVGRVDPGQKGVQLIIKTIKENLLIDNNSQFVFLGTGDTTLEKSLHTAASSHQDIYIATRYDEPLAAKIYAASDLMIIPSKYEPCGLVQMIAMRYAAIPVARATGGLADTIKDNYNGFLFEQYSHLEFAKCLRRAKNAIANQQTRKKMRLNAINSDFGWDDSANTYAKLYKSLQFK